MDILEYVKRCGESANRKGWKVTWEEYPAYLLATIDELTDSFDSGWRDDNKAKAFEEIGDCLIRLFHIIHDLEIPIEEILNRLITENEHRPYKHNRKRI
jgi:NTP pyrophosphatase (non-canonical NTP hydrolase)